MISVLSASIGACNAADRGCLQESAAAAWASLRYDRQAAASDRRRLYGHQAPMSLEEPMYDGTTNGTRQLATIVVVPQRYRCIIVPGLQRYSETRVSRERSRAHRRKSNALGPACMSRVRIILRCLLRPDLAGS